MAICKCGHKVIYKYNTLMKKNPEEINLLTSDKFEHVTDPVVIKERGKTYIDMTQRQGVKTCPAKGCNCSEVRIEKM